MGFIPGGPVDEHQLENTFDYLCADLLLRYKLFKASTVEGLLSVGFEYGYLLDFEIESDFFPINSFYPVNEYQDNWEKHNVSFIPSLSFVFNESTILEFGFNRSITPVLETEHLIVKDWIWTVRLYQSIPGIFK